MTIEREHMRGENFHLKIDIVWNVMPYSVAEIYRRFGGMYCPRVRVLGMKLLFIEYGGTTLLQSR